MSTKIYLKLGIHTYILYTIYKCLNALIYFQKNDVPETLKDKNNRNNILIT